MKKKIFSRCGLLALTVMVLNACSAMKQEPSPIETGGNVNQPSGVGGEYVDNNPYGTSQIGGTGQVVTPPVTYPSTGQTATYVGSYAPVNIHAATHTVVAGDTVYNISKRYQISQDSVRSWNGLADNNIRLGQVLRVKPAGYVAPVTTNPVVTTTTPTVVTTTTTTSTTPSTTVNNAAGTRTVAGITWMRPTVGKVLNGFNSETKGINYGGQMGQAVVAAADGKVVYSGTGLRTYGNLIIVQHNQTYLTAYGNNKQILLKEGAQVKRGQTIAYMGNSDSDRVQLHFEVREQGKPVDPSRFIP